MDQFERRSDDKITVRCTLSFLERMKLLVNKNIYISIDLTRDTTMGGTYSSYQDLKCK